MPLWPQNISVKIGLNFEREEKILHVFKSILFSEPGALCHLDLLETEVRFP